MIRQQVAQCEEGAKLGRLVALLEELMDGSKILALPRGGNQEDKRRLRRPEHAAPSARRVPPRAQAAPAPPGAPPEQRGGSPRPQQPVSGRPQR